MFQVCTPEIPLLEILTNLQDCVGIKNEGLEYIGKIPSLLHLDLSLNAHINNNDIFEKLASGSKIP